MIKLSPTRETEYDLAFETMRENMISYYEEHGLPWDQDWVDGNFRHRDNYSIFNSANWIGFLSLEWRDHDLFIHTLQLSKPAQGSIYGARVYEWILEQLSARGKQKITCKTFRGASMIDLYKRLGFTEVANDSYLVTLEMYVNNHRLRGNATRPSYKFQPPKN